MKNKKEDLTNKLLNFLRTQSNDPSEICTALSQCLYICGGATIEMYGHSKDCLDEMCNLLDKIKNQLIDEFNNHV